MRMFGKLMQVGGLVILPVAIILQLVFDDPQGNSNELERPGAGVLGFGVDGLLIAMVFGVCLFVLGRFMEGYAGGSK
ncbi:MAG: hypothetical protein VX738_12315 [Planctomycetota bacterium]|nr:hypothetical protein [Planctomycetota bacterium]